MPRALILGCSHAAGAEISNEPGLVFENHQQRIEYEAQHSYAWLIAEALGYEPHNHAISGGSNDAMFRIYQRECQHLNPQDLIIACWTGMDRTEIYHQKSDRWLSVTQNGIDKNYRTPDNWLLEGVPVYNHPMNVSDSDLDQAHISIALYILTQQQSTLNKLRNISAINGDARNRSIPVLNIDTFAPVNNTPDYSIQLDSTWPIGNDTYWDWAIRNKEPHTDWGHFYAATHKRFANYVLNKLQTNIKENTWIA